MRRYFDEEGNELELEDVLDEANKEDAPYNRWDFLTVFTMALRALAAVPYNFLGSIEEAWRAKSREADRNKTFARQAGLEIERLTDERK